MDLKQIQQEICNTISSQKQNTVHNGFGLCVRFLPSEMFKVSTKVNGKN